MVCVEKINFANYQQFEDLLIYIILHELKHGYFASGTELSDVNKHIIEESLCEAYAFSKFYDVDNIFDFITNPNRPPEYTSFKFWIRPHERFDSEREMHHIMADWRSDKKERFVFSLIFNSRRIPLFSYRRSVYSLIEEGGLPVLAMLILMSS